jgi:hypothetical protein
MLLEPITITLTPRSTYATAMTEMRDRVDDTRLDEANAASEGTQFRCCVVDRIGSVSDR